MLYGVFVESWPLTHTYICVYSVVFFFSLLFVDVTRSPGQRHGWHCVAYLVTA